MNKIEDIPKPHPLIISPIQSKLTLFSFEKFKVWMQRKKVSLIVMIITLLFSILLRYILFNYFSIEIQINYITPKTIGFLSSITVFRIFINYIVEEFKESNLHFMSENHGRP
jgi:hypothetical protein